MLKKVLLSADVYSFCATHAFITEKEEIMGLLIGEKVEEGIYKVSSALALKRFDKKSDRVEISPEQLTQATMHVENMSERLQRPLSIVGWYHSHPHITAMPSDVDIRTQASYQLLDQCFIGLILSVFNTSKSNQVNRMQVCCFQSCLVDESSYERVDVDMEVVASSSMSASVIKAFNSLPFIFFTEENELFESFCKSPTQPALTRVYNKSIFIKNLIEIMESIHIPLLSLIENNLESNRSKIKSIQNEKETIKKELENLHQNDINSCVTTSTSQIHAPKLKSSAQVSHENPSIMPSYASTVQHSIASNNSSHNNMKDIKSTVKMYGETSI